MNTQEIRQWIDNDEGLYNWYHSWRRETRRKEGGMDAFIKAHRAELVAAIKRVTDGVKPPHYLAYGG
jgi:hypothetical protein